MRKWKPIVAKADDNSDAVLQIVLPKKFQHEVLSLAHGGPAAGHLGVASTRTRLLKHFFWRKLRQSVALFCRCCKVCQMVGKVHKVIPKAPLCPIKVEQEPFSRLVIDCVGPLPISKSGHQYLLTIMCCTTRYPEAIPLRNIRASTISAALVKFFYNVWISTRDSI